MLQLSSGVTIDTIRNHFFVCDKRSNRWLEISEEADLFLKKYFNGNKSLSAEELKFIEFLCSNGYLVEKVDNEGLSKNKHDNMQIIVETSSSCTMPKTSFEKYEKCNSIILKYNPQIDLSYYINLFDPASIIVDEEYLEDFLESCKELLTGINIIINYKQTSLEDLITYVSELYINGVESIDLYYNVVQRNVESIESFICLAKEYMLGFNWNLAWCMEKYSIDTVFRTMKNTMIAYDKYKFATYPTSPLFKLNSFLPCYKCNFPQNKKYISADGKEKLCEYIKKK